jgi:hypothetical protein
MFHLEEKESESLPLRRVPNSPCILPGGEQDKCCGADGGGRMRRIKAKQWVLGLRNLQLHVKN